MSLRRLVPALCVSLLASAAIVGAAPAKKKGAVAPAKDPSTGSGSGSAAAAGSGSAAAPTPVTPTAPVTPATGAAAPAAGAAGGTEVQMSEDEAPKDINGTDENPDAPRAAGVTDTGAPVIPVKKLATTLYPTEEVLRPITLPENMSEVGLDPQFEVARPLGPAFGNSKSEFVSTAALRARYGITREVQLGLTYEFGGVYTGIGDSSVGFNAGRAVGLDVTVLLQNWLAVQVGVPVYLDPVAVALTIAAPIKFAFFDGKLALGGLDDLLAIKLHSFVPSFNYQSDNDELAHEIAVNTITSNGDLRFSAFGIYQMQPDVALVGRIGVDLTDLGSGPTTTYLRALIQWSPRNYLDLGAGAGFDDLAHGGTFGLNFLIRVRI